MSEQQPVCPKCSGVMERGYVEDEGYGHRRVTAWSEGEPQQSIWMGVKRNSEPLPIAVFRCTGCGFLESYAQPDFKAR
jgi:hypothetical protein